MHHFEQKGCTDSQSSTGAEGLAALGLSATWPSRRRRRRDRGTDEIEVSYCFFKTRKRSKWLPTAEMQTTELASIPAFVRSHIATHLIGYQCIKNGRLFGLP
jgi:hypothetical protein